MPQASPLHVTTAANLALLTQNLPDGGTASPVSQAVRRRRSAFIFEAIAHARASGPTMLKQEQERMKVLRQKEAARLAAFATRKPNWWSADEDLATADGELYEGIYDEWWSNLIAIWERRYERHFGRGLAIGMTAFGEICRDAWSPAEVVRAISPHVRRSLWARVDVEVRLEPEHLLDVLRTLSQGPFRLMDLPACVRLCVYDQIEELEWTMQVGRFENGAGQGPVPTILHVSRELREVAISTLTIVFHFDFRSDMDLAARLSRWYYDSGGRDLTRRVKKIDICFRMMGAHRAGTCQHVIISCMGIGRQWSITHGLKRERVGERWATGLHFDELPQDIQAALEAAKEGQSELIDAVIAAVGKRWTLLDQRAERGVVGVI